MKHPNPCAPWKRGDTRFTVEQFVKHNIVRTPEEEAHLRAFHAKLVADGGIPPLCEVCGWHHPASTAPAS